MAVRLRAFLWTFAIWLALNLSFNLSLNKKEQLYTNELISKTHWRALSSNGERSIATADYPHTGTANDSRIRDTRSQYTVTNMTDMMEGVTDTGRNAEPPFRYWNLSCPLEMSGFSAAHIGGADFLRRANKAAEIASIAQHEIPHGWSASNDGNPRRIVFVGDSIMRQVFISLACLAGTSEIAVPWFSERRARTNQANTFEKGEHSKFEEARVWLQDAKTELIFHHGIGRMVSLGPKYEEHDPNMFLEACFRRKPFKAVVVAKPDGIPGTVLHEGNTQRETIELGPNDVVVINGSVHGERQMNLANIEDVMRCIRGNKDASQLWPQFVYLATGYQHFPTPTGRFELGLLNITDYDCLQEVSTNQHAAQEQLTLGQVMPILGLDVLELQSVRGDLHIGGRDCLHWIMPGVPDLLALSFVRWLLGDRTSLKESS